MKFILGTVSLLLDSSSAICHGNYSHQEPLSDQSSAEEADQPVGGEETDHREASSGCHGEVDNAAPPTEHVEQ